MKSKKLGIKALKLPLKESGINLSITRKALNINHIVNIICKYRET